MASFTERSSSSRNTTPLMPGGIVIAYDATKNRDIQEFKDIITDVLKREKMIQESNTITLLGVLDKVLHPMGFQIQIGPSSFIGAHARAIKEEVSRKVDACVGMLRHTAEECEGKGVDIKVKISVGAPMKNVLVEEILALQSTWAILDRQLRKDLRFYLKHIPCKIAHVGDNLSSQILRSYYIDRSIDTMKHKLLYSLSKPVPLPPAQDAESDTHSLTPVAVSPQKGFDIPNSSMTQSSTLQSKEKRNVLLNHESGSNPQQEISAGSQNELGNKCDGSAQLLRKERAQVMQKERSLQNHSEVSVPCTDNMMKTGKHAVGSNYSEMQIEPGEYSSNTSPEEDTDAKVKNKHDKIYSDACVLGTAEKIKMGLDSLGCSYSNIQTATDNFSSHNLLGEGGYGVVYKGQLKDGQLVAVKVQKEANTQGFAEFHSELFALSFARHTNVVALLGYCCEENRKILIYEYIRNKSLEWHLSDNTGQVLEWNRRHAIAIGTAKGLRFLHEECPGCPIIHRDVRPSSILLTHDFVPLLGDCGLAKWKTKKFDKQRILGNLAYFAPEYAENGICSVKTDVYAFGILLIQLISGRKAVDSTQEDQKQSIRQWALSLIQTHALHDLVDPRLGDSYSTYDLYNMARAAYLCVQAKPASRPTMGEVLCILEGTNDHLRHVKSNLYPIIISTEASTLS